MSYACKHISIQDQAKSKWLTTWLARNVYVTTPHIYIYIYIYHKVKVKIRKTKPCPPLSFGESQFLWRNPETSSSPAEFADTTFTQHSSSEFRQPHGVPHLFRERVKEISKPTSTKIALKNCIEVSWGWGHVGWPH